MLRVYFPYWGLHKKKPFLKSNELFSGGISYQVGNKILAKCGLINSLLTDQLEIKEPCYMAELYWDEVYQLCQKNLIKYTPINKFQKRYIEIYPF